MKKTVLFSILLCGATALAQGPAVIPVTNHGTHYGGLDMDTEANALVLSPGDSDDDSGVSGSSAHASDSDPGGSAEGTVSISREVSKPFSWLPDINAGRIQTNGIVKLSSSGGLGSGNASATARGESQFAVEVPAGGRNIGTLLRLHFYGEDPDGGIIFNQSSTGLGNCVAPDGFTTAHASAYVETASGIQYVNAIRTGSTWEICENDGAPSLLAGSDLDHIAVSSVFAPAEDNIFGTWFSAVDVGTSVLEGLLVVSPVANGEGATRSFVSDAFFYVD